MKPKLKRVALLFLRFVFASYYIGKGGGGGGGGRELQGTLLGSAICFVFRKVLMSPLLWPTQIAHRKTQKKTNKTNCNYHGKSAREAGQLLLSSSCSSPSSLGATTEASASSWHSPDFAEHIVGVSPLRVAITFAYLHATASRLQIVANASELSMNGRPTRSVVSRLAKDCCEYASVCVCVCVLTFN